MTPATTSPEANTELIRAGFEEYNAGDLDACVARLAPDFAINLGVPATGRNVRYVSHEFYCVAGGLITEEWICSDMATLMRQIS